jgi:hypothetical protein
VFILIKLISIFFDIYVGSGNKFIAVLCNSLAITQTVNMVHFKFRNSCPRLVSNLGYEDKIMVGL